MTPFILNKAKASKTRNKIGSTGKHHPSTGQGRPLLDEKRGPGRQPVYNLLDNKELTELSRF